MEWRMKWWMQYWMLAEWGVKRRMNKEVWRLIID